MTETTEPARIAAVLTDREREVVALIAQGLDTEDIAEEMFISRESVRQKIKRIRAKVGGQSMLDLPALVEAMDAQT